MTQGHAADRLNEVLQGPFQRMQQLFGGAITINDAIARAGTTRENETPGSRHFHGDALDLNTAGMSPEEQLRVLRAEHAAGFRGFGLGAGILHVDMGSSRSWAYGNDTFGGMPLAQVQAMLTSGEFSAEFPILNDAGEPLRPTPENIAQIEALRNNSSPDFGDAEGEPTSFQTYDVPMTSTAVEQEASGGGTTTPDQTGAQGRPLGREPASAEPIDSDISEMIQSLTGRGDQSLEELREFLRQLTENETGPR